MLNISLSKDLEYLIAFTVVLILSKILLRFKIPSGVTSLITGFIYSYFDPSFAEDSNKLFSFLAMIGITSLFLFAGLEVETKDYKKNKRYFGKYLIIYSIALISIGFIFQVLFGFGIRTSLLFSLGIFTPSAGFILSSMRSYDIKESDEYWVKSKAIGKEIISIILMFFILQISNLILMATSLLVFASLYFIIPYLFKAFFKFISPYAPNTEVSFLVTIALVMGVLTKELGTYYIIGAFMVGLIASKFKSEVFDEDKESFLRTISSFFGVFLPFYFFYTGLSIDISQLSPNAAIYALSCFIIFTPIRMFLINMSFNNQYEGLRKNYYQISLSLMPTLIFGIIIAKLIIESTPEYTDFAHGLIGYTILTSIFPALINGLGKKRGITF